MRADAKSGLFRDAGLLFIPHLTDKPHGAVLVALVTTSLTSQIASSLIATRTMRGGQRGLMLAPAALRGPRRRLPAGLAVYSITTSLWTLGRQTCLWRLTPAAAPSAAPPPPERPQPRRPARPAAHAKAQTRPPSLTEEVWRSLQSH